MITIIGGDFTRSWLSLPLSHGIKVKGGKKNLALDGKKMAGGCRQKRFEGIRAFNRPFLTCTRRFSSHDRYTRARVFWRVPHIKRYPALTKLVVVCFARHYRYVSDFFSSSMADVALRLGPYNYRYVSQGCNLQSCAEVLVALVLQHKELVCAT